MANAFYLVCKHESKKFCFAQRLTDLTLGIFSIAQGLVNNFAGLVACRFIIGILEAGLIPGSIFLLSAYYPRYELQWRVSMLHVGNATSNAFGGLLAYGVASINSSNGWSGWRWIFVIEGLITVAVTVLCYPFMSNWPTSAKWLKEHERAVLKERIRQEGMIGRMDVLNRKAITRCVTDWKVYLRYGISIFLSPNTQLTARLAHSLSSATLRLSIRAPYSHQQSSAS